MIPQIYRVNLGFAKIEAVNSSSYFIWAVIKLLSLHITCWLLYSADQVRCNSSAQRCGTSVGTVNIGTVYPVCAKLHPDIS